MSKYSGEDIPFKIKGTENIDLDGYEFQIWHYVDSFSIHKLDKSQLTSSSVNTYEGVIGREWTAVNSGPVTLEIRLFDTDNNLVKNIKSLSAFNLVSTLIGNQN